MNGFVTDTLALGFWGYRSFGSQDTKETVKMWKDAGFNVGLSFIYHTDDTCQDKMRELLDCCLENGLKVILYDDRIHCHRLGEMSEDDYERAVLRSVEEFGRHPAAGAFFISDEPNRDTLPLAEKAAGIVGRHSPIPAFVNFFPMWRSKDYVDLVGVPGAEIDRLYTGFAQRSGLRCMAYDCYGAMNLREADTELDLYFDNLNTWHRIAAGAGLPLWTSLLCTGHWAFRQPTLTDMRWQVSTALAHGVQGIQWFMLYDNEDRMGDSPIDKYNEKQPSYYDMRKVNREFSEDFGELIPRLELQEVYHFGSSKGRTPLYAEGYDPYLKSFQAKYRDHAVISRFRHTGTGRVWYMFVNSSREAGNEFSYRFAAPYEHLNGSRWLDAGRLCVVELAESPESKGETK